MGFWGNIFRKTRKAFQNVSRLIKVGFEVSLNTLTAAGRRVIKYARDHPWKFGISSVLIVGGIAVIVVPLALGFSATGPVMGSFASAWQATIGNVQAGSLFALIQSWAMTGKFYWLGGGMIATGIAILLAPFGGGGEGGDSDGDGGVDGGKDKKDM